MPESRRGATHDRVPPGSVRPSARPVVGDTPLVAVILFDPGLQVTVAEGLGLAAIGGQGVPRPGDDLRASLDPAVRDVLVPACHSALDGESRVLHLPHATRRIRALVRPTHGAEGAVVGGLVVTLDVTEAVQQAARIERSESEYRELVEHSAYGIYRSTPDGRFLSVNPALVRMLGYDTEEELLGVSLLSLYATPGERERLIALEKAQRDVNDVEVRWIHRDGHEVTVRLTGRTVYDEAGRMECFEKFVEDVTERHALEAQLRQSQKMEAIGQLVGGIAHDFNNILTTVMGNAEFVLEALEAQGDDAHEAAADIRDAAASGAALVRKMMTVSRKEAITVGPADLGALTAELLRMARRLLPTNIEVISDLPEDPLIAQVDRGAVEQTLLNLLTNARDAMPAGGRIEVELTPAPLTADRKDELQLDRDLSFVRLSVRDSGSGMDEATLTRVFEPFFTTKPSGAGTGLGLAMVYGLMRQHRGAVRMESMLGVGTVAHLYFPLGESASATDPARRQRTYRGEETVLLVDDNLEVRSAAARLLERSGFRVLQAEDGEEALGILRERSAGIDLVLSDVMMPKVGGRAVYDATRSMASPPRFLFCSGYLRPEELEGLMAAGDVDFLPKPWTAAELTRAVRRSLDGGEPASGASALP
ncbi:MAG: PAS domain S-box protein [Gemmatimonadetes bacterium]|nr:PAS domain S-box protein [Gemmatimonadota bacterium]